MLGRQEEAEAWLLAQLPAGADRVDAFSIRVLFALCANYMMEGELERLRSASQRMVAAAQLQQLPLGEGWARLMAGYAAYEADDFAVATAHFESGARLMFVAHAASIRECLAGLIIVQIAQAHYEDAATTLARLREFRFGLDVEIESLAARLALAQGDVDAAARWVDGYRPGAVLPFLAWQEVPELTAVRVLIALGSTAHLRRAAELVQAVTAWAERSHNLWRTVECHALHALVLDGLGNRQDADRALRTALTLGQRAGYVRLFVDLGARLAGPLRRQLRFKTGAGHVRRLLTILAQESQRCAAAPAPTGGQILEPLTVREQQVLALLAHRLSNKEIASELMIAPNTVKRHTLQIFAKLGVADRRAAVAVAREQHLLP
jgi:LuxR family maltose regulon positive regulatory protein